MEDTLREDERAMEGVLRAKGLLFSDSNTSNLIEDRIGDSCVVRMTVPNALVPKQRNTVSMTYRMLARLCEKGRLRAFESAYLLERATARARHQLAALRSAPA